MIPLTKLLSSDKYILYYVINDVGLTFQMHTTNQNTNQALIYQKYIPTLQKLHELSPKFYTYQQLIKHLKDPKNSIVQLHSSQPIIKIISPQLLKKGYQLLGQISLKQRKSTIAIDQILQLCNQVSIVKISEKQLKSMLYTLASQLKSLSNQFTDYKTKHEQPLLPNSQIKQTIYNDYGNMLSNQYQTIYKFTGSKKNQHQTPKINEGNSHFNQYIIRQDIKSNQINLHNLIIKNKWSDSFTINHQTIQGKQPSTWIPIFFNLKIHQIDTIQFTVNKIQKSQQKQKSKSFCMPSMPSYAHINNNYIFIGISTTVQMNTQLQLIKKNNNYYNLKYYQGQKGSINCTGFSQGIIDMKTFPMKIYRIYNPLYKNKNIQWVFFIFLYGISKITIQSIKYL